VGRTEYADRTEVASQAYESVPVGGPCEVRYREAEPSYHRLEAPAPSGPPQRARDVWPIFLLLESLLVAGLLIFKRVVCRERALARDGEVAAARIIERGQEPGGSKSPPRYWVRYEFLGPAGRTESGRRFLPQPVWDLYTVGAAVPLLFTTEPRLRHRLLASITHVRFEGMTEAALAIIPAGHPHPEHDRRGPRP
jgi:hypothetical protein